MGTVVVCLDAFVRAAWFFYVLFFFFSYPCMSRGSSILHLASVDFEDVRSSERSVQASVGCGTVFCLALFAPFLPSLFYYFFFCAGNVLNNVE